MSKRKVRKRRHIVEAKRAAFQQSMKPYVDSVRREIDEKLLGVARDLNVVLERPLGLLRGTVPPGQSFKLAPGEFIGMLDCGGNHYTIEELDAAAGPWHELPGAEKLWGKWRT